MRKVGGAWQRLEAAAWNRFVRFAAVPHRDRAVALSPDDQSRHVAEQVETIAGADMLAVDVDNRAQRLQERPPRARLLQGPQGSRDRFQVDALRAAAGAQPPTGAVDHVDELPLGRQPQQW